MLGQSEGGQYSLAELHTTLSVWEDAVWLDLLDRNNSVGGRNSDLGVLKHWTDEIDRKYLLDLYVRAPNLADTYRWSRKTNGFRWVSGSITRRDLATHASFKTEVEIGKKWDFGANLDMVRLPTAKRAAFRMATYWKPVQNMRFAAKIHLDPEKPGTDLGLGMEWHHDLSRVTIEFWALDVINDLIHVTLKASDQPQIRYREEYVTQSYAIRGLADVTIVPGLRVEGYGAYLPTSRLLVTDPGDRAYEFTNTEDVWYGAALLEWKPVSNWMISAFGTNQKAISSKIWPAPDYASRSYELDERTTRLGAATVYRPLERLEISWQGERNWRPQVRLDPASSDTTVNYTVESWLSMVGGRYQTTRSWFFDLWVSYLKSDEPLGSGQVPTADTLTAEQFRVALDIGWWFTPNLWFSFGAARDFGSDESGSGFGGARGRGALTW